jgi:topoisomerase IA-like protein
MATLKVLLSMKQEDGKSLGTHQGRNIRLKSGRFGIYLQWDDDGVAGTTTHSLPKEMTMAATSSSSSSDIPHHNSSLFFDLTLERAIGYVELPRTICNLDDSPITTGIGPFGPHLKYNNSYVTLRPERGQDVLTIDTEQAMAVVTVSKRSYGEKRMLKL